MGEWWRGRAGVGGLASLKQNCSIALSYYRSRSALPPVSRGIALEKPAEMQAFNPHKPPK